MLGVVDGNEERVAHGEVACGCLSVENEFGHVELGVLSRSLVSRLMEEGELTNVKDGLPRYELVTDGNVPPDSANGSHLHHPSVLIACELTSRHVFQHIGRLRYHSSDTILGHGPYKGLHASGWDSCARVRSRPACVSVACRVLSTKDDHSSRPEVNRCAVERGKDAQSSTIFLLGRGPHSIPIGEAYSLVGTSSRSFGFVGSFFGAI